MIKEENESCSNINWNDVWKIEMEKHNNLPGNKKCLKYFDNDKIAGRYNSMIKKTDLYEFRDDILESITNIKDIENMRILDIGAGPGTHTLPLSNIAKEVTAVEPAKAMLSCLKDNLKSYDINNVVCINKDWEDVKLGKDISSPYDIVMASFSLGMTEIESSLRKMNDASSGYVFLGWFTKVPTWDKIRIELWPLLYGVEYVPMPRVDCLVNVLWQMGIYPNISTYHKSKINEFSSMEELLNRYVLDFEITTKEQEEILKDYFNKKLIKKHDKLLLRSDEDYSIIWWKK